MSSIASTYQKYSQSKSFQKRFGIGIRLVIAAILIFFSVFPVLWIVSASLNSKQTLATQTLIPDNPNFDNYRTLLEGDKFPSCFWDTNTDKLFPFCLWLGNSIKIAGTATILSLSITTMAAYAFSRLRFKGRVTMLKGILLIQVFPNLLALVAIFLLIQQTGEILPGLGLNTHGGLILVYLGGSMGINIWLMKGFLDTIPRAIDESAMVDGATNFQIFWNLLLPLLRPILVVIGILSFIGTYGDFILARILLKSTTQYTLMVGLQIYTSGQFSQKWGVFAAGALMGALPIMIIYLALQDQIVGGLTQGAVKE